MINFSADKNKDISSKNAAISNYITMNKKLNNLSISNKTQIVKSPNKSHPTNKLFINKSKKYNAADKFISLK